ncbi:DUF4232 domain-containing protein [Streptomyces alkaliphilus]|uniref:DUF4232 domain-containing protein n=1 Tax=Streptomyces alkaliphilus TaxID=1472722 RepID=A0A7W3TBG1_9ACTN|nr:DUF4232 domain-containing protein [Streptomyces alkaliphilus]MBB0243766.1 DUF4232 domain-containing protein [Streptomyces alkaliphilus]
MSRNRTLSRGLVAAGLTAASLALAACQSGSDVSSPGGGTAADRPATVVEETPVEDTASGENTAEDTPAEGAAAGSGAPAAGATRVPAGNPAEGTDAGEAAPVPAPQENGPSAVPAGDRRGKEDSSRPGKDVPVLPACTSSTTKLTVAPVPRPVNHLLLTVTNTGSTACAPYNYPYLRFDEGHSVMQVVRSSVPQAVVVLEPGESAYAGIRTSSADDSEVRPVEGLEVFLTDRNGRTVGNSVTLPVPAGTAEGASAAVTYWQSDRADALMW